MTGWQARRRSGATGGGGTTQRRALYFGTPFFGYHRHIATAARSVGFHVDHFNDRPSEKGVVKGLLKVVPQAMSPMARSYLNRVLEQTTGRDYDLVLIVNGKICTAEFIEELRRRHPRAQIVLYLWDAIGLYPHVLDFADRVDRRYTFDSADAAAYPQFELLPLFFTKDYRAIGDATRAGAAPEPSHDLVSVCTVHANRYVLLNRLVPALTAAGLRVFDYRYLNRLQFAYNRVRCAPFRHARAAEFHFQPLPHTQHLAVLARSRAVLDINHSAQTGLTMRTIETVGARRKLITTNAAVAAYDVYDPTRVLVLDPHEPDVEAVCRFLAEPARQVADEVYQRYDIDRWVATVFAIDVPSVGEPGRG